MQRLGWLIITAMLALCVGCGSPESPDDTRSARYFKVTAEGQGVAVETDAQGRMYFACNRWPAPPFLLVCSADGTPLRSVDYPGFNQFVDMAAVQNRLVIEESFANGAWYLLVDHNGTVLFSDRWDMVWYQKFIPLSDGGWLMIGREQIGSLRWRGVVVRYDAAGNKPYSTSLPEYGFNGAAELADGTLCVAISRTIGSDGVCTVYSYNPHLTLISQITYRKRGSTYTAIPYAIGGALWLLGTEKRSGQPDRYSLGKAETDSTFSVEYPFDWADGSMQVAGGRLLFWRNGDAPDTSVVITARELTGRLLWRHVYRPFRNFSAADMTVAPDGDLILTGRMSQPGRPDSVWVMRTGGDTLL